MNLRITSAQSVPYKKEFLKPFTIAGNPVLTREGFIISIHSDKHVGIGEIAPLDGVSPETLKKAKHDLSIIEPRLQGLSIIASEAKQSFKKIATSPSAPRNDTNTSQDILNFLRNWKLLSELCPSVRFGVESALVNLAAACTGSYLAKYLGATKDLGLESAGLLQGTAEQVVAEATAMLEEGIKTFKLKVGNRNIPLDVNKVQQLRSVLPDDALIRLDANRAWAVNEAILFGQLVGVDRIEFIEEPLSDMGQTNLFYQKTSLPVALDESLSVMRCGVLAPGRCSPTLAGSDAVKAYVLKPTILGGITVTLDWIHQAKDWGKTAVISSSFESEVGLDILKELALLTDTAPGLGTDRWFQ